MLQIRRATFAEPKSTCPVRRTKGIGRSACRKIAGIIAGCQQGEILLFDLTLFVVTSVETRRSRCVDTGAGRLQFYDVVKHSKSAFGNDGRGVGELFQNTFDVDVPPRVLPGMIIGNFIDPMARNMYSFTFLSGRGVSRIW